MMLKIGNRGFTPLEILICKKIRKRFLTGFTLMEVMIATCVLSLGSVLIYESFFITLNSFNYYSNYLNLASWMNEKIWQAQDNLRRLGSSSQIETTGEFANRNKNFRWNLSYNLISQNLYQINLTLFWQEGQRNVKLSRSTYAMYEEKK